MMRYPSPLWLVLLACMFLSPGLPVQAADPAPAAAAKPVSLVGLSRDDVLAVRGKPSGERQRGDLLIMVYPDGTKLELRAGVVVAASGGSEAAIVGADGTRYLPGEDGNIKRPVEVTEPGDSPASPTAPAVTTAPVQATDGSAAADAPAATPPAGGEPVDDLDEELPAAPAVPAGIEEALDEDDEAWEDSEDEELSPVFRVVSFLIGMVLRFGLTVLVLRLALHVVGVPFFWPDLLKVALLYIAVHEVLSGLGELGGWWEFIPVFRLDDVFSFIILACSLTWFKIAGSGLTALKIAVATKVVIVALMLAVGVVLAIGFSALQ